MIDGSPKTTRTPIYTDVGLIHISLKPPPCAVLAVRALADLRPEFLHPTVFHRDPALN
ncbi:hypothetical protein ROBYS_44040 [Roseobacter sp. OBYS 0001]|nr:hypothetical protein ROBYS_44040 [Roseobacter sp. OBYS 0001]